MSGRTSKSSNGQKIARMARNSTIFGPNESSRRDLFLEKFSKSRNNRKVFEKLRKLFEKKFEKNFERCNLMGDVILSKTSLKPFSFSGNPTTCDPDDLELVIFRSFAPSFRLFVQPFRVEFFFFFWYVCACLLIFFDCWVKEIIKKTNSKTLKAWTKTNSNNAQHKIVFPPVLHARKTVREPLRRTRNAQERSTHTHQHSLQHFHSTVAFFSTSIGHELVCFKK